MLILVTGGAASGKSELAEKISVHLHQASTGGKLLYIATMFAYDEESKKRIEKHQLMRKDKNFQTLEAFYGLDQIKMKKNEVYTVLLECMSNLVANELFMDGGAGFEDSFDRITTGIKNIVSQVENLIVVSNEIFSDEMVYEKETLAYIKLLGKINRFIGNQADTVVEAVFGLAYTHKGSLRL